MLRRIMALTFALALVAGTMVAFTGAVSTSAEPMDKVTICHHTGSETNTYVKIEVNGNALEGHDGPHHQHGLDIVLPDPADPCPGVDDDGDVD